LHLEVEASGELVLVVTEGSMLVTGALEITARSVVLLSGPVELELSLLGELGQLSGSLLGFEKCVVVRLDATVSVGVFLLSSVVEVKQTVEFFLVTGSLFLLLVEFEGAVVAIFP